MKDLQMTAVGWMREEIKKALPMTITLVLDRIVEQAEEMEKQQMWDYIETNYVIGENSLLFHKQEFEQYYAELYGK
jgi:hypothetical protein